MSRDSRREKGAAELKSLEREFEADLLKALADRAYGSWGLFESNPVNDTGRLSGRTVEGRRLVELGEKILAARVKAGIAEEFWLFERFKHFRAMSGPNDAGEPKLADALLAEIESRRPSI